MDARSGVNDDDYQPPFRFTGKIDKLTIKLVPPNGTTAEEKLLQQKTSGLDTYRNGVRTELLQPREVYSLPWVSLARG